MPSPSSALSPSSAYLPGDEVRLRDGLTGVLYSRTRHLTARSNREGWYFLPDGAGAPGLVVLNQPRFICEQDIAGKIGARPGPWPSGYLTDPIQRQRVYVAHMRGDPLP